MIKNLTSASKQFTISWCVARYCMCEHSPCYAERRFPPFILEEFWTSCAPLTVQHGNRKQIMWPERHMLRDRHTHKAWRHPRCVFLPLWVPSICSAPWKEPFLFFMSMCGCHHYYVSLCKKYNKITRHKYWLYCKKLEKLNIEYVYPYDILCV